MKTLLKIVPAAALAVTLSSSFANAQGHFQGQWMTTADGCTYSRTQAPGYPPQWILVGNPTHINKPYGGSRCKNML